MPCRCDDYTDVKTDTKDTEIQSLKMKIDNLTQLLCYSIGQAKYAGGISSLFKNPKLKGWSERHDADDYKRVITEMKRYLTSNPDITVEELSQIFILSAENSHAVSDYHKTVWFPQVAAMAHNHSTAVIAAKKAKEEATKVALAKLTAEEKKLLGIKE